MKKRILVLALVVMMLIMNASVAFAASGYDIDIAKGSVVRIVVDFVIDPAYNSFVDEQLCNRTLTITGSGFAVGEYSSNEVQYFVTAAHVVLHNDPTNPAATSYYLPLIDGTSGYVPVNVVNTRILLGDESSFVNAYFMGRSDRADVAVISISEPITARCAAVLLDKETFDTNAVVSAMGFPGASDDNLTITASDQMISTTSSVTVNAGVVSRVVPHATTGEGDQIQTTAAMSSGISGGPLVDAEGYVVGVCTSGSVNSESANYASSTSEIIRLLNSQTGLKYTVGPVKTSPDTLILIIIAAAAVIIILLIVLIIVSSSKKNSRTLVFGGELVGRSVPLKKGKPVVVGRDPSKCKVAYGRGTPGVSAVHCTITFDGKNVSVADNGSSYGTFVGGVKVEPGRPVVMHRGQEITFGSDKNSAVLH